MQWLRDLSLSKKMLTYISSILVFLLVFGFINIQTMLALQQKIYSVEDEYLPNALVAKDMSRNIIQIQQWLTDISATRGLDGLNDGFEEAAKSYDNVLQNYSFFKTHYVNNPIKLRQLDEVKSALDAYYKQGKVMAQAYVEKGPHSGNEIMGSFDAAAKKMHLLVTPFLDEQVSLANEIVLDANRVIDELLTRLIILFLLVTFVLVAGAYSLLVWLLRR